MTKHPLEVDMEHGKHQLESTKELSEFLNEQGGKIGELERKLMHEFQEVEHIKHNLSILKKQLTYVEKLSEHRTHLLKGLFAELAKRISDIDLRRAHDALHTIQHLDGELRPMLERMLHEADRVILSDTHKLYALSGENKKAMELFDEDARKLLASIRIIHGHVTSHDRELSEVREELSRIHHDRTKTGLEH